MKTLRASFLAFVFSVIFAATVALFPSGHMSEEARSVKAPFAELLSDESEEETGTSVDYAALYGDAVTAWDIPATSGTDTVTASLYAVSEEEHILVISGSGKMPDWASPSDVPWYKDYRKTVSTAVIESGVTNIGMHAFYFCERLTSVTVADSVKTVGTLSFYFCTSLEEISILAGGGTVSYSAFASCTSLRSISLGKATLIRDGAFEDCTSLVSVTLPNTVSSVGLRVFSGCTALTEILVDEGSSYYLSQDGDLYSADGADLLVYAPGKTAEEFKIPEQVINVADYAFEHSSLVSISVAGNVTSIGSYAFRGSEKLGSIVLGDGVAELGAWAFAECPMLTSVYLGAVGEIGAYAFYSCTALEEIVLPDAVSAVGASAFYLCTSLKNADLGCTLSVGNYAFWKCDALESVDLGSSVTDIGMAAFRDCTALRSVSIPKSVVTVGAYAFGGCTALSELVLCSSDLAESIASESDLGCAAMYAVNIYLPLGSVTVGEYITANFGERRAVYRDSELCLLYSTCIHTWKIAESGDYVCSACSTLRAPSDIISASVTLGYDLSINVYADVPTGAAIDFVMNGTCVTVYGEYQEDIGLFKYTFTGVTPQCMGDLLSATLVADGAELDTLTDYSISKYCRNLLAISAEELGLGDERYAELRTLVLDLLDYGAASQLYTGYETDSLVNEGLEGASVFEELSSTDLTLVNITPTEGVAFTSANLVFDNTNRLSFRFTAADISAVTVRLEVMGEVSYYTEADLATPGEEYMLLTDSIYADRFDDVYTVTLIVGDTEVQTLTYSVRSYVYDKQNSSNTTLADLVRNMYKYGASAVNYSS